MTVVVNGVPVVRTNGGRATSGTGKQVASEASTKALVALVFDDGYKDNRTNAAPILAEYNFTATLAIESERVGQDYAGEPDLPVCTAADLRELSRLGWEIANHPDLNPAATEAVMVSEALAENTAIRELMTGELLWDEQSQTYIPGPLSYPEFSNLAIKTAVYRGGIRNETSDRAYRNIYDRVRGIPGDNAIYGNFMFSFKDDFGQPQMVSAFGADTNGDDAVLEGVIAYLKGVASSGTNGLIYAHAVPESGPLPLSVPYITKAHFEILCQKAFEFGVRLVSLDRLGSANLFQDPMLTTEDAVVFANGVGDEASYDTVEKMNSNGGSYKLTANTFQANLLTTSVRTLNLSVDPFTRYRIRFRYKIDTDLTLNGGPANRNHGLGVLLSTIQGNSGGDSGGSHDDWNAFGSDPAYNRPYQATGGEYLEHDITLITGYGFQAQIVFGLFQCTGTVYIGGISIEEKESVDELPLSGESTYDLFLGRVIVLPTPPVSPERNWAWEMRVVPRVIPFGTAPSQTVNYAYSDSSKILAPQDGETVYVLGEGLNDFVDQGGKVGTYASGTGTWSFVEPADNTFFRATVGEGISNFHYWHITRSPDSGGIYIRVGYSYAFLDQPKVERVSPGVFRVYSTLGNHTASFEWVAKPYLTD